MTSPSIDAPPELPGTRRRRGSRILGLVATAVLFLMPGGNAPPANAYLPRMDGAQLCRDAVARAENVYPLPDGLLGAIAITESGRRDPLTGTRAPWPWTVTAQGQDHFYATRAEAIEGVLLLRQRGVQSIDVGCMQVNLFYHPDAFASLEDAFDPEINADYAARFLVSLYGRATSWMGAAMAYHSLTPEVAAPYGARIAAAWGNQADALPHVISGGPDLVAPRGSLFEPGTVFPVALPRAFRAAIPAVRLWSARSAKRIFDNKSFASFSKRSAF